MKKKTLAAASLLLALLMPLGATPLAVYAEGEGEAPAGISAVSEDPEGTGETNAQNGVTPPTAEVLGSQIWNSREQVFYATLEEATKNAQSGDTLYLGKGNYTLYGISSVGTTKGKDLTFVGSGVDVTAWNIGAEVPNPDKYGTEYNGDYSFDGAGTVTFENMTLRSGSVDYLGFIRADKTVVDNCTINGKTFYWGYTSATFTNTIFNAPFGDYAIWTYSSPVMTFDNCTFDASGKVINVYTDAGAGKNDITVNFNNCTVNSTFPIKPALNINDSNMGGYKYILNITNANVTAARDSVTCSQVFGFGGKAATNNTGRTDVNLDGELVFSAGKKLTHSYTDGEHDQAYNYTGGWSDWTPTEGDEHLLYRTRTLTKICKYCSYSETLPEEREEKREYLLHYDLNGGTGAEGVNYSDNYYFEPIGGNTATVAAAPSRAGYQFAG